LHPAIISPGKVRSVNIRQVKTSRFLYYGLSTEATIGMRAPFKNTQCITYFGYDGTIYANNRQKTGSPSIFDGSIITVVADLVNYKIKWLER